jgi:hypothetical protein
MEYKNRQLIYLIKHSLNTIVRETAGVPFGYFDTPTGADAIKLPLSRLVFWASTCSPNGFVRHIECRAK